MNRNIKRVAFALVISAGSFWGTVFWFNSGIKEKDFKDTQPIAILNESTNEVQRKPETRLIWESVTTSDSLYTGEAIRTSSSAEAKIRLLKSGTIIHLEPDSLVVLVENEKGLRLDFEQGNLFVQSTGDEKAEGITLKAGASEVTLKSAELSLSRETSGAVNMAVYKGQAELQQGNKKISLDKESSATLSDSGLKVDTDRIQVIWPNPGDAVLLNLVRSEQLEVNFKPLAPGYTVVAEWGSSRAKLQPTATSVSGETGKLPIATRSGKWFMRLVAKSEDPKLPQLVSNILPVNIGPKTPPTPAEPADQETVIKGNSEGLVAFRWVNRHRFKSQTLEIATDREFKKLRAKKLFDKPINKFEESLPEGTYFWRVTGYLETQGKSEALESSIVSFKVQDRWELKAPKLIAPEHKQLLTFSSTQQDGVLLKWQAPAGVKKFTVLVRKKNKDQWENFAEPTVEVGVFRLENLQPGLYQWRVSSWDPESGAKKDSEAWIFSVSDMPKVEWVEAPLLYEFTTPAPTLRAEWKPLERAANSFRYKVLASGANLDSSKWKETKALFFETEVPAEGKFVAYVEALNERGQVVGQSAGKSFEVKKFLLLPPPNWVQSAPDTFKTDPKGNLTFAWEEVPGADHYIMILENENGKILDQRKVDRTTASLKSLKPGNYKVLLKSVDAQKREGDQVNSKALVVPATSDINAPKFKSMKVQ